MCTQEEVIIKNISKKSCHHCSLSYTFFTKLILPLDMKRQTLSKEEEGQKITPLKEEG